MNRSAPPKVAHLCHTFSALSETFIYDTVTELERLGVPSTVLALERQLPADRPFKSVLTPGRFRGFLLRAEWAFHRLRAEYPEALLGTMGSWRRAMAPLLEYARPDILHCHFGPMGLLAAPLASARGIPLITTFHGYDVSLLPQSRSWREAYMGMWHQLSAAVVISEEMRGTLTDLGCPPTKVWVVRVGMPADLRFRLPTRRVRRLLSVGRLIEKKGHLDVIRALAELHGDRPEATLRIIGGGPLLHQLRAEVERSGLDSVVTLLGPQPRAVVLKEMRESDAFVLCSRTAASGDKEGAPTTLVEAAVIGLPCVSTRHAGIPEIIAPENHWLLAEEGDVSGIAARLRRLLDCDIGKLRQIARTGAYHVRTHFDLSAETRKLVGVYDVAFQALTDD